MADSKVDRAVGVGGQTVRDNCFAVLRCRDFGCVQGRVRVAVCGPPRLRGVPRHRVGVVSGADLGDGDRERIEADDRGQGDAHGNAREPAEDDVALIARDTLCSNPWGLYPTRAQLRHLSRYVGADGPFLEPPDAKWLVR